METNKNQLTTYEQLIEKVKQMDDDKCYSIELENGKKLFLGMFMLGSAWKKIYKL